MGNFVVRQRNVALPRRVAGIGDGEALSGGEAVTVDLERLSELALRFQYIAYPHIRPCLIALPFGIAGMSCGKSLSEREAVRIEPERLSELALRLQHIELALRLQHIGELPLARLHLRYAPDIDRRRHARRRQPWDQAGARERGFA